MRVGVLIPSLHGGGAEFVARTWMGRLAREGHHVSAYTYARAPATKPPPAGVALHHADTSFLRGPLRYASIARWLRHRAEEDGVDVVLSLLTSSNIAAILAFPSNRESSVPVVISERNMARLYLPLEGMSGMVQERLARRLYRHAAAAIAISHPVAAELTSHFAMDPGRVYVVPNPVLEMSTVEPVVRQARAGDTLRVGFVGRLAAQKQPDRFVQAIVELHSRGIKAEGVIIGDGPLRESLAKLAEVSNVKLTFLGWREPWIEAARDMDCLMLPSTVEGFGNVLVESAAVGVPAVAPSTAQGVADAIVPGLTGAFSLTCEPADLADAVLDAVENASFTGIEPWLRRFSVDTSAGLLTRVLERTAQC